MKNKKMMTMVGIMLCMGMMMTGCSKTEEDPQAEVQVMSMEEPEEEEQPEQDEQSEGEEQPEQDEQSEGDEQPEQDADQAQDERQDEQKTDGEGGAQTANAAQGTEYLGGKVQSPQEDGMVLAQTTLTDEDGMVTLLDVKDAKKIPVKFTADTKVEHWTIQGGGAGIDMKEASFSDLKEGLGVELEGYFEGETFVAARVIIEEYV